MPEFAIRDNSGNLLQFGQRFGGWISFYGTKAVVVRSGYPVNRIDRLRPAG